MSDYSTNWTRQELKAYILIFCANADFVETKTETEFIKNIIDEETYNRLHQEFDNSNDYQSVQKIVATVKKFGYSTDEIERLFTNIKKMYLLDGKLDILEQNLYNGLRHILSPSNN